ncbi:MAG: nitrous oxide reductase accessory protein NosL [Ignavibacteriales bacterium]|nr:nitrous oxide reductase accessory protein NosL [Ignavibacteriales bacterium]
MKKIILILIVFILSGCSNKSEPINYGYDSCDKCRMQIVDRKYGTELVTSKGKIYKFDSIECLVFFTENSIDDENFFTLVTDYLNNNELINSKKAFYLQSENLRSPMGLNITAFSSQSDLKKFKEKYAGKELSWKEIIEYVNRKWQNK